MSRPLIRTALAAATLAVAFSIPAYAQGGPDGDCPLTSDEVADVLKGAGSPMVMGGVCTWLTGSGSVIVGVMDGFTLDMQRTLYPGGKDKKVAGHDAYYAPDANQIWVDLDGRQLFIALVIGNAKHPDKLISRLAEAAVARVPALVAPAPGSLASMFPTEIGGAPLLVNELPPDQIAEMMGADPGIRAQIDEALAGMGKTMADLEVAFGRSQSGSLIGYRIAGQEADALLPLFIDAFLSGNPGGTAVVETIAGKDVTVAAAEGQTLARFYPSGEVLWTVVAVEPGLSEILTALP